MTYRRGEVYKGGWQNNVEHGKGVYHFASGNVYEGQFVDGKRTDINGTMTWPSGKVYVGPFANGLIDTGDAVDDDNNPVKGKLTWPKKSGEGKLPARTYEGEFDTNALSGKGKMVWPTGFTYEGDFFMGAMTGVLNDVGEGKFTWPKDSEGTIQEYEGAVMDGLPIGSGRITIKFEDGNESNYEGDVKGCQNEEGDILVHMHGFGSLTYTNKPGRKGKWESNEEQESGEGEDPPEELPAKPKDPPKKAGFNLGALGGLMSKKVSSA